MDDLDMKGWYELQFTNSSTKLVNLDHAIRNTNGFIIYLVDHDKRHYNFNNVLWFKREIRDGG